MEIILNGEKYILAEENLTIDEFLSKLSREWKIDLSEAVILINDEIVKKSEWKTQKLANNYHLEILSFGSGG